MIFHCPAAAAAKAGGARAAPPLRAGVEARLLWLEAQRMQERDLARRKASYATSLRRRIATAAAQLAGAPSAERRAALRATLAALKATLVECEAVPAAAAAAEASTTDRSAAPPPAKRARRCA